MLLFRDTGYVVHLVFHGAANATHYHADQCPSVRMRIHRSPAIKAGKKMHASCR